jgi:hypothetical protein
VTVSADKSVYAVGDPITVTVEYPGSADGTATLTITAAVTNADGSVVDGTVDVQVATSTPQTLGVAVTDSFGDLYAQVSNDAGTAVFSSTVGAPPA